MASAVQIRAYNVRFGDCVLVSIGADADQKHVLFDFGNAPSSVKAQGGNNDVFEPIARDIAKVTDGKLDLLVMSHEHLDHMEGFYHQKKIFDKMDVRDVWMSIMSAPDYYRRFPKARPEKSARLALSRLAFDWGRKEYLPWLPEGVNALIANNVLSLSNPERIQYLRELPGSKKRVHYLYRGKPVTRAHGLGNDVKMDILGPEKDASVYYGSQGGKFWMEAAARFGAPLRSGVHRKKGTRPRCPTHIAREEFEQLRDDLAELDVNDLLAIDKAANNTSLVVRINVAGKTLLFPGDAEQESWAVMKRLKLLQPVDLLKVAHHGSINGMPFENSDDVTDVLLKSAKKTTAIVSTCRGVYGKTTETAIPHFRLMDMLHARCGRVVDTEEDAAPGQCVELELDS